MKYKVLIISLLLILAVPYGATACGREGRDNNPHRTPTEKEIAEHDEAARRIAEEETATIPNIIRLVFLNIQAGGIKTVDFGQQFQTLYEGLNIQVTSLENSMNNLTTMLEEISGKDLFTKVVYLTQELNNDKATNEALRREIDRRKLEQAEANTLLDDVLKQSPSLISEQFLPPETPPLSKPILLLSTLPSVTSSNLITEEVPASNLPPYQQGLLSQKDQIGDEAWKLLGGENTSLAAALFNSIQQNSGKTLEVSYVGKHNFKLRVDGKEQSYSYTF